MMLILKIDLAKKARVSRQAINWLVKSGKLNVKTLYGKEFVVLDETCQQYIDKHKES